MTEQQPETLADAFFDRLVEEQSARMTAEEHSLRQGRIFCGRWLALRRLELGLTLDRLAEQFDLPSRVLLFLETGLADPRLADERSWEQYSQLLSSAHGDRALVRRIVRAALGLESPPNAHVMLRLMPDLSLDHRARQSRDMGEQLFAGGAAARTDPRAAPASLIDILRWCDRQIGQAQLRAGTLSLAIRDPSSANILVLADIDLQDLRAAAIRGAAPARLLNTIRGASSSVLAVVRQYLGGDTRTARDKGERANLDPKPASAQPNGPAEPIDHSSPAGLLPREYLQKLLDECNRAVVSGTAPSSSTQAGRSTTSAPPPLAEIYVSLATDGPPHTLGHFERSPPNLSGRRGRKGRGAIVKAPPSTASIALADAELVEEAAACVSRLVLLGEPGSGKSSTVRYLACQLARHMLDATAPLPAGWQAPKLPIVCSLGVLAGLIAERELWHDDELLACLLQAQAYSEQGGEGLLHALRSGQALLLLDELEAVPDLPSRHGQSLRTRVMLAVQALARLLPRGTHILIACRSEAYNQLLGPRLSADDQWQVRTLQPLTSGQIRQLVRRWFRRPGDLARMDWYYAYATAIVARIVADPIVYRLCASPLMLTLLLMLLEQGAPHDEPRDRADIYDQYVARTLEDLAGAAAPAMTVALGAALQETAFSLCEPLAAPPSRSVHQPDEKVVLLQRWFSHTAVQEFLAACYLARSPDLVWRAYVLWQADDSNHRRDILLLMIEQLRRSSAIAERGLPWINALLAPEAPDGRGKTIQQQARDALLASDSYRACGGRAALAGMPGEVIARLERALAVALAGALAAECDGVGMNRLQAGAHLAALGDPRPGVRTIEPDCCEVPVGTVIAGDAGELARERGLEVRLDAFRIARYPVTNWLWQQFMDDGGYVTPEWWGEWWRRRERQEWVHPHYWDTPQLTIENQPVVGISWYEAVAFCAWLTARGHAAGWLRSDERVRLPTTLEWEKAARGMDGRIYPWGDAWDARCAHTAESSAASPAPVGCYPQGASPYGALDMSGNVAEWCDLGGEQGAVRRGGSWGEDRQQARCDSYQLCEWETRGNLLGFRVVVARVSSCS